jgi:pimeloyl-ACP methyl ester carboxylesterase
MTTTHRPSDTDAFTCPAQSPSLEMNMQADSLEAVELGDTTQWIRVRGTDAANPVLLLIQQGPGLPMLNEVRRSERLLGLESHFTVVYWDQRGCGRSLRAAETQTTNPLRLMVDDAVSLLEMLRDRFAMKSYVAGFSLGATVGAYAAAKRPDLVQTLMAVGLDVDGLAAANSAYRFALDSAHQQGTKRAIRQLEAIGPPPHLDVKQFGTRVRWVSNFGGVTRNQSYGSVVRRLLASLVRSSDYSAGDVLRTVRGIAATQARLLPEMAELNLVRTVPHLDVPLVLVQGRLDKVAPADAAQRYFDNVVAPSKELVWFEESAHTPQFEEPEKFRDLLIRVQTSQVAVGGGES